MAKIYSACWDFARLGLSGTGATYTGSVTGVVAYTTGLYAHGAVSLMGTPTTIDGVALGNFAATWDAFLTGTHTIVFSESTQTYTLANGGGANFAVTWSGTLGTELRDIMGFEADLSGANTYTSTKRPKYVIVSVINGQSQVHADYEPSGRVESAEADDGTTYSTRPSTLPTYRDWIQPFEDAAGPLDAAWNSSPIVGGAPVRISDLAAQTNVWWSWEQFYKHVRGELPFRLYSTSDTTGSIYKMRAEAAHFDPTRATADFDGHWHMPFKTTKRATWTL